MGFAVTNLGPVTVQKKKALPVLLFHMIRKKTLRHNQSRTTNKVVIFGHGNALCEQFLAQRE